MPRPRRRRPDHPGQHLRFKKRRFKKRRIPVCMYNVAPDQVYRPSYWNAFGMDEEGSDYRACKALGPMYK